ncbi:hypothetical protein [Runella sp.]|uniref:hypothetical protein n=1 Tax=Runella sp. TaxID=1960881 RepID=UPI0030170AF4
MINVQRGKAPASLQIPHIKQYLDELAAYKSLSEENRAEQPKPKCNAEYRNADLFDAFDDVFFAKCYLTEKRFENSWAMDVEHFKSKAFDQYPDLKYEWANLYPADHDANMVKPRNEPEGGYLDPCAEDNDVEKEILYVVLFGGEASFEAQNGDNIKAVNTAKLLDKIHNGSDEKSKKKTANLRHLIAKKQFEVLNTIIEWQGALDDQSKFEAKTKLKKLLSRKSSFTMLMRSLSAVRMYIPAEFLD